MKSLAFLKQHHILFQSVIVVKEYQNIILSVTITLLPYKSNDLPFRRFPLAVAALKERQLSYSFTKERACSTQILL